MAADPPSTRESPASVANDEVCCFVRMPLLAMPTDDEALIILGHVAAHRRLLAFQERSLARPLLPASLNDANALRAS